MPGVPSGRACEGCRKQKKKCDETRPSCSRCRRLQIVCIGSGQRRYKFEEPINRVHRSKTKQSNTSRPDSEERFATGDISHSPSNELTRLVDAFTERLHLFSDLRYSLTWAYGGFLADVPRRLGQNEALDAAASALLTSHLRFLTPMDKVTSQALSQYSHTLNALRTCLDDPIEACTANTLCAVMILLICQSFIGFSGNRWTSHCEGAAQILKARGARCNAKDEFERTLLLALRGPVAFEGVLNRKIQFRCHEWEELVENELDRLTGVGQVMGCLARVPSILECGRSAFRDRQQSRIMELRDETRKLYDILKRNSTDLHGSYLATTSKRPCWHTNNSQPVSLILYAHLQRSYGLALTVLIILNCIVRALCPEEETSLEIESAYFAKEIVALAEDVKIFRPLGSSYMLLCLTTAWIGTSDLETKKLAEALLEDYQSDFPGMKEARLQLEWTSRQFDFRHLFESFDEDELTCEST